MAIIGSFGLGQAPPPPPADAAVLRDPPMWDPFSLAPPPAPPAPSGIFLQDTSTYKQKPLTAAQIAERLAPYAMPVAGPESARTQVAPTRPPPVPGSGEQSLPSPPSGPAGSVGLAWMPWVVGGALILLFLSKK